MRRRRSQHTPLALEHYQRAIAEAGFFDNAWLHQWLIDRVAEAGGQQALSRSLKVAQVAISDAVTGKRRVSTALAKALGFTRTDRRVLCYRSLDAEDANRVAAVAQVLGVPVNVIFDGKRMVITPDQMRRLVVHEVKRAGSQMALSRLTKVRQRRISEALSGPRPVSSRLAVAFGFYRDSRVSVEYRPAPPTTPPPPNPEQPTATT
jgi:DNA-binding transcriptional regulator YdaS (Cro superfamily)